MSKQNTPPAQGDDVAANHIPCPTEPKIVPIGFDVEEDESVPVWVITKDNVHTLLRLVAYLRTTSLPPTSDL